MSSYQPPSMNASLLESGGGGGGGVICSACGFHNPGGKFCEQCGSSLASAPPLLIPEAQLPQHQVQMSPIAQPATVVQQPQAAMTMRDPALGQWVCERFTQVQLQPHFCH